MTLKDLDWLEEHLGSGPALEVVPKTETVDTFRIWSPSQFMTWSEPEGSHLLLPAYLTRGELTALIGQGGLGKSRLALFLAVSHILGRDWCGLQTAGGPCTWLMLGNENGIGRVKTDLSGMMLDLGETERAAVEEHLRVLAVDGDSDLCLSDLRAFGRLQRTIAEHKPG